MQFHEFLDVVEIGVKLFVYRMHFTILSLTLSGRRMDSDVQGERLGRARNGRGNGAALSAAPFLILYARNSARLLWPVVVLVYVSFLCM